MGLYENGRKGNKTDQIPLGVLPLARGPASLRARRDHVVRESREEDPAGRSKKSGHGIEIQTEVFRQIYFQKNGHILKLSGLNLVITITLLVSEKRQIYYHQREPKNFLQVIMQKRA